jgi:hypothetical protein
MGSGVQGTVNLALPNRNHSPLMMPLPVRLCLDRVRHVSVFA